MLPGLECAVIDGMDVIQRGFVRKSFDFFLRQVQAGFLVEYII